jgi:hypothetical protein
MNISGEKKRFVTFSHRALLRFIRLLRDPTTAFRPAGLSVFSLPSRHFEACSSSEPRLLSENTGRRVLSHAD